MLVAAAAALAAGPSQPQKIVLARVFPNAGQIGLFIASADGTGERPLLPSPGIDYDAVWSPDGSSIVFTSDREGSADLFRVKPDGTGLERLTDSPAYDDQAAFSPDGKQIVFVSTRSGGTADLWAMDVQTRRAKALTSGPAGDFRPSWSPDGTWIAFSSDRGSTLPSAHGRWERLHVVDLYVIHPDGSGLKRITEHGNFCGSPKWQPDSRRVIAYCMTAEQTLANRRAAPEPGNDTRLVAIDIATGASSDLAVGPGVKIHTISGRTLIASLGKVCASPALRFISMSAKRTSARKSATYASTAARGPASVPLMPSVAMRMRPFNPNAEHNARCAAAKPSGSASATYL